MNKPEQLIQWADSLKGADPYTEIGATAQALADLLRHHYGITYATIFLTPEGAIVLEAK